MVKVVFTWRDNAAIGAAECERHYRAVHMPLARAAFDGVPGFRSLRYNRVRRATVNDDNQRAPRAVEPDIDAWVELSFDSEEQLGAAMARPPLQALFDDHPNFMEVDGPANIHVYWVDEDVIAEAP
jgi:uncharacterized protein (TIGR02118 family)